MRGGVLGLDLSASPRRPTAAVALGLDLSPHFVDFVTDDDSIYELVRRLEPRLIAIDAPLTLPRGSARRTAELELARLRTPCYFTTERSIIWATACRGVALAVELRTLGFNVIEVYPYASKVRLWGDPARKAEAWGIPKKRTRAGKEFLRRRLGEILPGLRSHLSTLDHDLADAALAAYTGWLHLQGRSQVVGGEDGPIVLPATPQPL